MTSIIVFIAILFLGYISTNFIFGRLKTRYYIPSGVEYIFLGIILGPAFANWFTTVFKITFPVFIDHQVLIQMNPGIALSIGFVGFIYGLNFKLREIVKSKPEHWRLAFSEIIFSLLFIGGISFILLYYFFYDSNNFREIIAASYAIGIIGSLSSNYIINSLISRYSVVGKITESLRNASLINVNLLIFLYGLLFASVHVGTKEGINFTPTEWIVISVVLTLLIGFLFFLFLGRESDSNKYFVAVLGIIIFTSGVAYYINFSPLYMNFILGAILANLSKTSENLRGSLDRLFNPLTILIVVMAGFYWIPCDLYTFIIVAGLFVLVRFSAKLTAGWFADYSKYENENLNAGIGKALLPLDVVACAMVLDYMNVYKNEFSSIVMSAILSGVIFFGIFSYSSAKNHLIDSGEIAGEKL
nr:hypothetical protein [uncultured Sphaerochaeta sp.]